MRINKTTEAARAHEIADIPYIIGYNKDDMVDRWTNFVKYGDPNGNDKEVWRPYTEENQQFMIFKLGSSGAAEPAIGKAQSTTF